MPSNEGLTIELHLSVQYHVHPDKVVELYSTVGNMQTVHDNIIAPQVHASVRAATSARDAKALYTAEREQVRASILTALNTTLAPRGIFVEDVPLRAVVLPARLQESIKRKLQMEQESERMDWVLKKEEQGAPGWTPWPPAAPTTSPPLNVALIRQSCHPHMPSPSHPNSPCPTSTHPRGGAKGDRGQRDR